MLIPSAQQKEIPHGTRVLLRASLNAPVQEGKVVSAFRIRETLRTVEYLKQKGARITVIGHIGRDGGSLAPVHSEMNKVTPVSFIKKIVGEEVWTARKNLRPGEALLLENTRSDPREEKRDMLFAEEMAAQADLFVFDDFTAAHRSHASTTGLIELLPSCAGIRFYEEITALLRITERRVSPAVAVLGGAKCGTKLPLIKNLLKIYDTIFVTGVLGNTMLKRRGHNIGASRASEVEVPEEVMRDTKIVLPGEVLVTRDFTEAWATPASEVKEDEIIVDVGDKTLKAMRHHIEPAKTVLLNGPLGWYEKGFFNQTAMLSGMVGRSEAYSFAGGGDTVALLERHNLMADWEFVSTGGGSALTYLAEGRLAVVDAFEEKVRKKQKKQGA